MSPQPQQPDRCHFRTRKEFLDERKRILGLTLEGPGGIDNARKVQNHVNAAIEDEQIDRIYRTELDISMEEDIQRLLPAYTPDNLLLEWNLKALRRWAMRRYAFCLAGKINERLQRYVPGEKIWRAKDFALPRMGFAMLLGYGALLGAGNTIHWLEQFKGLGYWILLALCGAAIYGLVHVNVRNQIGRNRAANVRTAIVCAIVGGWILIGMGCIWAFSEPKTRPFYPDVALLCSMAAMLLGIVGQFFFSGNKSMADPL
jgi:hypothetical protein